MAGLRRTLEARLVDAIVLAPHPSLMEELARLRSRLPAMPIVGYAPFRADDGELMAECERQALTTLAIEGVDDAVIGDLVVRCSLTTVRRHALADGPGCFGWSSGFSDVPGTCWCATSSARCARSTWRASSRSAGSTCPASSEPAAHRT